MVLTIRKLDDASGVILPDELLARMHLKVGDKIYATETSDGIHLTSHDAGITETLEIARQVMREDRDLLEKQAE